MAEDPNDWVDVSSETQDANGWEDVSPSSSETQSQKPPDLSQEGQLNSNPVAFDSSAIPLVGSVDALKQGYNDVNRATKMVVGDGVIGNTVGPVLGALGGAAEAIGTVFNPISKALSYVPRAVQAGAEAYNGETGNATRTLTGERSVRPDLKPTAFNTSSPTLNTALNFADEIDRSVEKDPTILAQGLGGESALGKAKAEAIDRLPSQTTDAFGDYFKKANGETVEPSKVVPSNFSGTIASAFAKDLPLGKSPVRVNDFKKALETAAPELHRTNPNIADAPMLHEANLETQRRAGQFLNEARQKLQLPDANSGEIITNAEKEMLGDDALVQRYGPSAIKDALKVESLNLTENFPTMNPDQLQNIATDRKKLATPLVEQLRKDGSADLNLKQEVNLAIHNSMRSALDDMYAQTPGADYARKVYGATKVIDKGITKAAEKIGRKAYEDDKTIGKAVASPASLIGIAATVIGHIKAGGSILAIKAAQTLHKIHADHLVNPNTKINNAFNSLRKNVDVIQKPRVPYIPQPKTPALSARDMDLAQLQRFNAMAPDARIAAPSIPAYSPETATGD